MEPLSVKRIKSFVKEHEKWDTNNELVFEIENDKKFDLIPYLGEGSNSTKTLSSFPILVDMDQKELKVCFKQQLAAQGIHLTTIQSSTKQDCPKGHHFTLGCCHCHRVYQQRGNVFFQANTASASFIPQYNPEVKIGARWKSRKNGGSEGKKMARRTETCKAPTKEQCCPFNFTFKLDDETERWVLLGGTGSSHHTYHAPS
jgi:hypothetical protein